MYSPFEIEKMLHSMEILVDTREQPNQRFKERTEDFGLPWARQKLDFGDYSCRYVNIDGEQVSLQFASALSGNDLRESLSGQRSRGQRYTC